MINQEIIQRQAEQQIKKRSKHIQENLKQLEGLLKATVKNAKNFYGPKLNSLLVLPNARGHWVFMRNPEPSCVTRPMKS